MGAWRVCRYVQYLPASSQKYPADPDTRTDPGRSLDLRWLLFSLPFSSFASARFGLFGEKREHKWPAQARCPLPAAPMPPHILILI